jgi:hypothetical protein
VETADSVEETLRIITALREGIEESRDTLNDGGSIRGLDDRHQHLAVLTESGIYDTEVRNLAD